MRRLLLLILCACSASPARWEPWIVEGVPSFTSHGYAAWEQGDGQVLIEASPWTEGGGFFTLDPGSLEAEPMNPDLTDRQREAGQFTAGPHSVQPLFVSGERLERWDHDSGQIVDLAVRSPDPGATYLQDAAGHLLAVGQTVQAFDADTGTWSEVAAADAQVLAATRWSDRAIGLTPTAIVELSADGLTELATCSEDCDDTAWGRLHHAGGDLWIQDNWRWWSFDGRSITSLGRFPNPGWETAEAEFITQVMTTAVVDARIVRINRSSYNNISGRVLSWKPGQRDHTVHDHTLSGGWVGSAESSLLLVPFTGLDPLLAYGPY